MTGNELVLNIALTWSIGLLPPILLRYIVFRRELVHAEAMAWAIFLGLGELFLFVFLGSESKSHAVLALIGIVAYKLLRVRRGPWDAPNSTSLPSQSGTPIQSRSKKLDTPAKRFLATTIILWIVAVLAFSVMSYVEHRRAGESEANGRLWSQRLEDKISRYCSDQFTDQKCNAGQTERELQILFSQSAGNHSSRSELYLILAIVLGGGFPALVLVGRWILHGPAKAN